jgi:YegS/Rv2252/BmrU family lipid kinase
VPAPISLIVNPVAGGGKSGRIAADVASRLRAHGLEVQRSDTEHLSHARELAVTGAAEGMTIVALSGDGMVGAIADALKEVPGAVLGVVPGGRGNDLARVLGIPDDPEAACAIVAAGHTRAVDLGVVGAVADGAGDERAFVGIASAGFDSDANRIANEAPAWLGGLVYAYGAIRALMFWRPARFEVQVEPSGERLSFTGYSIAAANSKAYGGGMMMAPDAMLDDGQLEIIAVEHVGKARFLANLPKVFRGTHVEEPTVKVMRASEVSISADRPFTMYADGDPIGDLPVRVRAVAGAITMIVPREDPPHSAFSGPSPASAQPSPPAPAPASG